MTYELDGSNLLFPIRRADILDISANDVIAVKGLPGLQYVWTDHDAEFVENNPDDEVFLQIERADSAHFRAIGIVLK
jgi:hypothetical protein